MIDDRWIRYNLLVTCCFLFLLIFLLTYQDQSTILVWNELRLQLCILRIHTSSPTYTLKHLPASSGWKREPLPSQAYLSRRTSLSKSLASGHYGRQFPIKSPSQRRLSRSELQSAYEELSIPPLEANIFKSSNSHLWPAEPPLIQPTTSKQPAPPL